jgi:hypothetical protein
MVAPGAGKGRSAMTAPKIERTEIRELITSELDVVCGGNAIVGLSVANQTAIALKQELTAAYLAHNFDWSSHWGTSAP